jgi:hypothetical protein
MYCTAYICRARQGEVRQGEAGAAKRRCETAHERVTWHEADEARMARIEATRVFGGLWGGQAGSRHGAE